MSGRRAQILPVLLQTDQLCTYTLIAGYTQNYRVPESTTHKHAHQLTETNSDLTARIALGLSKQPVEPLDGITLTKCLTLLPMTKTKVLDII